MSCFRSSPVSSSRSPTPHSAMFSKETILRVCLYFSSYDFLFLVFFGFHLDLPWIVGVFVWFDFLFLSRWTIHRFRRIAVAAKNGFTISVFFFSFPATVVTRSVDSCAIRFCLIVVQSLRGDKVGHQLTQPPKCLTGHHWKGRAWSMGGLSSSSLFSFCKKSNASTHTHTCTHVDTTKAAVSGSDDWPSSSIDSAQCGHRPG